MSEVNVVYRVNSPHGELNTLISGSAEAACHDICADVPTAGIDIYPGAMVPIPTGLYLAIPTGWEGQVRPRSGLAKKNQITIQNTPGTIDSDYRGEIIVLLRNEGPATFKVNRGDRIAQLAIREVPHVTYILSDDGNLGDTARGAGGFGSTGVATDKPV